MGDIVKFKHLIWAIGGMVVFAFTLGWNVNSKLAQVDINKAVSEENSINIKELQDTTNKNYIKILLKLNDIEVEMQNKKNRE